MRIVRTLPIVVLLVAAAGCGTSAVTDPAPPTRQTSATAAVVVPAIANPLSLDAVRPQPCTVLTPAQLTALGLPGPGQPAVDEIEAKLRDYCTWWLGPAEDHVEVSMPKNQRTETLAGAYAQHDAGAFAYFEETAAGGYPAVFGGITDNRAAGGGELRVGVAADLAVDVTVEVTTGADPGAVAANVAAEVVATVAAQ